MSDKIVLKNTVNLKRLKELIDTKTREEIATAIHCDTSLITKHYNGNREITVDYVVKYAKYFNVSADYLLGLTETKSQDTKIKDICEYTGLNEEAVERLHRYIKETNPDIFGRLEKIKYLDFINFLVISEHFLISITEYKNILKQCLKGLEEDVKAFEEHLGQEHLPISRLGFRGPDLERRELASYRCVRDFEFLLSDYTEKDDVEIDRLRDKIIDYMESTIDRMKADSNKEGESNANHNEEE